ncbi:MAG: helical backbone metal receptor [Acidimicrobiales bacterium]|jgi:iron complex transport system substrate-binding protein
MFKTLRFVLALMLGALALPLLSDSFAGASSPPSPMCVVSLSPTATETLFAIGAGSLVQAVDTDSDYPTTGLPTKRINALNPSVEAVLSICRSTSSHPSTKPDLVVISYDANSIQQKLTSLGVKVVLQDAATSVGNALSQIRQLGQLTGHVVKANALASSLSATITADIKSIPPHPTKKITVYYEVATHPYYSLTSQTFVGSLMKSLGLVNIADADSTTADAGYPQLSAEYIISANPKLIFLDDSQTPASIAKRTGFSKVSAVENNNVIALNEDIASRWGPRLGILMNQLTAVVKTTLNESKLWKK